MARLKIPEGFINLTLNLFQHRRNYVLTDVGVTQDFEVLVGIDQGEVISPLLWCIYYDPLLTRINRLQDVGYALTHSFQPDINNLDTTVSLKETVASLAFMDDTMWCSDSHTHLQEILAIANSFYAFTNIKTNDSKACLMTTLSKPYHPPGAPVGNKVIFHQDSHRQNSVQVQPYKSS